jgi:hypothetical protein
MRETASTGRTLVECLECGEETLVSGELRIGKQVMCLDCGTWMEVISLDPVEVDWIYEEPEPEDEDAVESPW